MITVVVLTCSLVTRVADAVLGGRAVVVLITVLRVGLRVVLVVHVGHRKLLSLRLLPTTNRLDTAIAAPASIGLSSPAAASGIAAVL